MMKCKKYYVGENHYKWEVKIVIYQKNNVYKFVLTDDEDAIYIASNYVTPSTANGIEKTINKIMDKPAKYETLADIYNTLKNTFYGQLFYLDEKMHHN